MAYYSDPRFGAEPFEELQQLGPSKRQVASPEALKAYYATMEKKEAVERNTSRRMSRGKIFKRKSVKRLESDSVVANNYTANDTSDEGGDMERLENSEKQDGLAALPTSRSIIPDSIKSLPDWYAKDDHNSPAAFRMRYPIHNPFGPRFYTNYHLLPPSAFRPGARPPTFFSPSFPPMTSAVHDHPSHTRSVEESKDKERMASPSRTPSQTPPLPTPSSSETRVADSNPRSRKTSQTAHVDMLDVTDPWGQNWHHQSPYDIGLGNGNGHGPVSAEPKSNPPNRSRRNSLSIRESRRKTLQPSPLSQSTSAIHLQPPSPMYASTIASERVSRKLSKRRAPLWAGLFGTRKHDSVDVTSPISPSAYSPYETTPNHKVSYSDSQSLAPTTTSSSKQQRRASVLGRLAKKFSVSRKSGDVEKRQSTIHSHNQTQRQPSPEKPISSRRIPPPSVDMVDLTGTGMESGVSGTPTTEEVVSPPPPTTSSVIEPVASPPLPPTQAEEQEGVGMGGGEEAANEDRRGSYVSIEAPPLFSIGKLTVANPDAPSSEASDTPRNQGDLSLPEQDVDRDVDRLSAPPPPSFLSSVSSPTMATIHSHPPQASTSASASTPLLLPSQTQSPPPSTHVHPPHPDPKIYLPKSSIPSSSTPVPSGRHSIEDKPLPSPEKEKRKAPPSVSAPAPEVRQRRHSKKSRDPDPSSSSGDGMDDVPPPPPSTTTKPKALPPQFPSSSSQSQPPHAHSYNQTLNVPFPHAPPAQISDIQVGVGENSYGVYLAAAAHMNMKLDDSPLSNSSVLANPPTPQSGPISFTPSTSSGGDLRRDEDIPPRVPSKRLSPTKQMQVKREPSPVAVTSTETETFRLVRSASGHVYASTETIRDAGGESWEVIEQFPQVSRDGSGSKRSSRQERESRDRESRRESRRQEKEREKEKERAAEERERAKRHHSADVSRSTTRPRRASHRSNSADSDRRREAPVEETRGGRSKEKERERRTSRKAPPPSSSSSHIIVDVNKAQPAPPPVRPTSEVPNAADLNALRAREIWEMERLYKAKSMTDTKNTVSSRHSNSAPPSHAQGQMMMNEPPNGHLKGGVHGSSHTSFVVQNTFPDPSSTSTSRSTSPQTQIYHSMPTSPPPIVYNNNNTATTPNGNLYSHPSTHSHSAYNEDFMHEPNPLPEPPRDIKLPPFLGISDRVH